MAGIRYCTSISERTDIYWQTPLRSPIQPTVWGWNGDFLGGEDGGWGRGTENAGHRGERRAEFEGFAANLAEMAGNGGKMALLLPRDLQWRLSNGERVDAPCGVLTL